MCLSASSTNSLISPQMKKKLSVCLDPFDLWKESFWKPKFVSENMRNSNCTHSPFHLDAFFLICWSLCGVPSLPVCSVQWSLCVIRWTTVSARGQRSREWGVLGHRSETGDTNHRVCLPDLYICNHWWSLNFGQLLSGIFQNFYLLNVLCNYALSKMVFKSALLFTVNIYF